MLKDLIVVGYYTLATPYEIEAKKTIASCNKFGLKHFFKPIPNQGNWQKNTRYKANFLLEMLEKYPNNKLLYIDCDAEILKLPILLDQLKDYDIAVRWQDFRWRKNECLSGTIFLSSNERTKELCRKWADKNIQEGNNATSFEQWNLGIVINEMKKNGLKDYNLPPEYTMIFDSMQQMYPDKEAVIIHWQASRKYKNSVNI